MVSMIPALARGRRRRCPQFNTRLPSADLRTARTSIGLPSHPRDALFLVAVVVVALEVFSHKAFTIDEPLFLWLGAHLQTDPWDFFGFRVNWYGVEMPMYEVTKNPPLGGYYIALAAQLVGWSEAALHRSFLLPAAAAAWASYSLARRLCSRPLEAAFIGVATPAFLVSSTNVMCDTLMLAFFLGSLRCWIEGLDRERWTWLLAASVLAILAFLTKYFALSLVPLFLAHGWVYKRRPGAWTVFALLPVLALVAYEMLTLSLYGVGALYDAVVFAQTEVAEAGMAFDARTLIGLVFAGGCLVPALFYAPLLWPGRFLAIALPLVSMLVVLNQGLLLERTGLEEIPASTWLQVAVMGLGGCSVIALAVSELWLRRDPDAWLLFLWVAGTLFFAFFVNWVNNGRSNLPAAAALGILIVRRLERLRGEKRSAVAAPWIALAASAALSLAVTYSDYRWAEEVRRAAMGISRQFVKDDQVVYFQGHWGFQYYMEAGGARAMRFGQDSVGKNELLVVPTNNTQAVVPPLDHAKQVARMIHREPSWLRTNSIDMSAGFYSSGLGALPFVFGAAPPDAYYIVVPKGRLGVEANKTR